MATDGFEISPTSAAMKEPWTVRADWAAGKIRSSQQNLVFLIVFTMFWNAISWTMAYFCVRELPKGHWALILIALFPGIGVLCVWAMVIALLRRLKFGVSVFEMASVPGVVGGPLAGVVHVPHKLHPEFGFKLKLNCIRHYQQDEDQKQDFLWQDEQLLGRELFDETAETTAIPVQFAIPHDVRESEKQIGETIQWQLEVQAQDPGIDYHETFDVPVFLTAASSPDFKLDQAVLAPFVINPTHEEILRAAKIVYDPTVAGECYAFPAARALSAALVVTGLLAIWVGAFIAVLAVEVPIFIPIVFGLFGLLIGWMCLELWLWSSRINIERDVVQIRSGWLGYGRTKTVSRTDVKSIETKQRMRSGRHAWFDVVLVTESDEKLHFGRYVYGTRLAKAVADIVMDAIRGR